MKKAVIATGGKQYVVSEGDSIEIELLNDAKKSITLEALLIVDGEKVTVGTPIVSGSSVTLEINEPDVQSDKVTAIRYKSKKRVHTVRGHRQRKAHVTVKKIELK